jgi:hypothetical protein
VKSSLQSQPPLSVNSFDRNTCGCSRQTGESFG